MIAHNHRVAGAVARTRLPQNAACRFPALRSSEVASQHGDSLQLRIREIQLWSQQRNLRGTGETDKPEGSYTTEDLADDAAAFLETIGVRKAHVAGLSLAAGVGLWLAAKYPERVQSLSLHSGWHKTDPFVKAVIEGFQLTAKALQSVPEMTIRAIFPWCFTPELYAVKPDYIQSLADFVRSRHAQPVASFLQQSNAVLTDDVSAHLERIAAPTLITFGRTDQVASTRFANPMSTKIRNSEVFVFEGCSHAPIYEKVEEFNQRSLQFLQRHTG